MGQRPWLGHGGQDRLVGAWCKKPLKLAASRVSSVEAAAPDKAARLLGQAGCWTTAVRSQHESVVCTCTTPTELAASIIIHTTVSTASLRLNATVRSTNENLSTTAGGDEDWATSALVLRCERDLWWWIAAELGKLRLARKSHAASCLSLPENSKITSSRKRQKPETR
jgi:hypothetical protein